MSTVEAIAMPQAAPDTALAQWRARMGLSQRAAAEALGASFRTYQQWESGVSRQTGKPIDPPLTALLAAAALESGLPPIS